MLKLSKECKFFIGKNAIRELYMERIKNGIFNRTIYVYDYLIS